MGQSSSSPCSTSPCSCRAFSATRTVDCQNTAVAGGDHSSLPPPQPDLTLSLPEECLASVFAFLPSNDRNSCSLVCKRWSSVDSRSRQRLFLAARSEISAALPSILSRFTAVSALSLKCSRKLASIDDHGLSLIPSRLVSLRKLKLKGCVDVSDEGIHAFSLNCPPLLSKISLASGGFGARGVISLLCNCPSLRDLTLKRLRKLDTQNAPLSIAGVDDTEKFRLQLERLCVKDLHNARIFTPFLCSAKSSLKTLIVCRSSGNWDRVMEDIRSHGDGTTAITEIQMENVQIGDSGLAAISNSCPRLEVLYLSRVSDCTDEGICAIANSCRHLRKIHIDAWPRFGGRSIGDAGISVIGSKALQLQELVLMGVPIKVSSLNLLAANCSSLERMALCNTDTVGDSEMMLIGEKFAALKKLCIKNCPVSVKGIAAAVVQGCPNLVKLKVKRCRGISEESVSHLRRLRGGLVISVDAGAVVVDGEEASENEDGGSGRRRATARVDQLGHNNNADRGRRRRSSSSSTHVMCSSRGANLLRSTFGRTTSSMRGS